MSSPLLPLPLDDEVDDEVVVVVLRVGLPDTIPEVLSKGLNTEARELLTGALVLLKVGAILVLLKVGAILVLLTEGAGRLTVEVGR